MVAQAFDWMRTAMLMQLLVMICLPITRPFFANSNLEHVHPDGRVFDQVCGG
jgi:hypothetical protein